LVEISRGCPIHGSIVQETDLDHGLLVRPNRCRGRLTRNAFGVRAGRHPIREPGYPADLLGPHPTHLRHLIQRCSEHLAFSGTRPNGHCQDHDQQWEQDRAVGDQEPVGAEEGAAVSDRVHQDRGQETEDWSYDAYRRSTG